MIKKLFLSLLALEGVLMFILLTVVSCNQDKSQMPQGESGPLVIMQKTECFGTCPVYTITIYADGKAEYEGVRHVQKIGRFHKQFSPETVNGLIKDFEAADFWNLKDEYVAEVTDLPTTYLSFNHGGRTKKIKDLVEAPQQLKDLEQQVAELSETGDWQSIQ